MGGSFQADETSRPQGAKPRFVTTRTTTPLPDASTVGAAEGWLGRLGGVLVHPRRTLAATLARPGRTSDLVFLLGVLTGLLVMPVRTAKAVAMVKISFLAALQSVVTVLGTAVLWEIVFVVVYATVLQWIVRRRPGAPTSEGVLAAASLALVPLFALALLGAVLDQTGLAGHLGPLGELLPNRPWRAYGRSGGTLLLRLAVTYTWTLVLLGWLTLRLLGRKTGPE